jgi:hypothetical protein
VPRGKQWSAGPRQPAREKLEERYAWITTYDGECVIFVQDPQKLFDEKGVAKTTYLEFGSGDNVHLVINPVKSRSSAVIMLTNLTEDELDKTKQLFDLAFEWARPVVQLRDREAREALESGDDVNPRNYRQVSHLVVRRKPGGEYGESVLDGHRDVSRVGDSRDGGAALEGGDRGPGSAVPEMAEDPDEDSGSEDDETPYYESTEFGNLGGPAADPGEVQVAEPPALNPPPHPGPPALPPPPPPGS